MSPTDLIARVRDALGPGPRPPLPPIAPEVLAPATAQPPLIDGFLAAARALGCEIADALPPPPPDAAPFDAPYAIRRAVLGIARSGSVALLHDDADPSSSLRTMAAPILYVALDPATLVPTVAEALALLPPSPTRVIISGPSKTADIEGILITGVHGPGRVVIVLDHRA